MAQKYELFKDSGSIWIGEIPSHWNIGNFRYFGEFTKGKLPSTTNIEGKGLPIIGASEMLGKECRTFTEETNVPLCNSDDILILWDGANAGIISSRHKGVVSSTAVKYHCLSSKIDKNYLFYYLKSVEPFFKDKVNGTTIPHMNIKYINEVPMLIPTPQEQTSIVNLLDQKCKEIESLISLQEEMITELQAYKQSVITEAVTKGLNPNAKMKDSGIEWIGEIPEEWQTIKLNRIMGFIGGYAFNSNKYAKEQTHNQVIRIGNVKNNYLKLDASPIFIDDNVAIEAAKCKLNENCILFTMTGTKGKRDYFYTLLLKKEHFKNKDLYLNQRVGCFVQKTHNIDMRYYNYLLKDNHILDSIFLYETGTANQGNLGIETINRTILQFPPLVDQCAIANYLDTQASQIDELIALKQMKIDQLVEYKKSVIYEYVTGKKRV